MKSENILLAILKICCLNLILQKDSFNGKNYNILKKSLTTDKNQKITPKN